jgi:hypothetical protein
MVELFSIIEHAALGEIIKRVITGVVDWAKGRKKPAPEKVQEKIEDLVNKNLPQSIPIEERLAVVSSLTTIVMPTLEQIAVYSPNTARIIAAAKKTVAKKAVAKKSVVRKASAKKTVAKKVAAKKSPAKKMAVRRLY